jgi:hypothetical protein
LDFREEITNRIAVALDLELVDAAAARLIEQSDALDYILADAPHDYAAVARELCGAGSIVRACVGARPNSVAAQSWLAIELAARALIA